MTSTSSSAGFQDNNTSVASTVQLCNCVVCHLLNERFSSKNLIEQLNIIKNGRSKPAMQNLTTKIKTCTRHFSADKTYEQYEWLTGCEIKNKLFCWPCLLFVDEISVWNKIGFGDLNNLHKVVKRHIISKNHLQAVIKEKVFGKTRIEHTLDKQFLVSHRKHNELVDKNRDILKRLIDIVCFLGQHELGFRGDDKSSFSANRGNYLDLVSLISKYDPCLKAHFEQDGVFQVNSNRIQNDLISAISTVILNRIKYEIKQTRFVAIILHELTDVTNGCQLSAVVRFVNVDGNIQERFLGFFHILEDRTADALYAIVCELVKNIDANDKLVAQSYDGAAVMAGHLGTLQTRIRATFPSAIFIHCLAHKLNLVLSESIMQFKECKLLFSTLRGMATFFSESTKRTQALDKITKRRLPEVSPMQWDYNGRLVLTVFEHRDSLIELFESILDLENNEEWDTETINSSRGFLDCLKNDFNFNFLMVVFTEIFPFTDNLFNVLQGKINDIGFCVKNICKFKIIIQKRRGDFEKCWEDTNNKSLEPPSKRARTDNIGDVKTSYRRFFYQIMDKIYHEIDNRFKNFDDLKFLELCNFTEFEEKQFPENQLKSLMRHYGQYFDMVLLRSELTALYDTKDIDKKQNASELLAFLKETALDKAYSEVVKLCELVLTIPATSASEEFSSSALKRIETYLQNSTGQDRLTNVSLLVIENNIVREMSQYPRFYRDVIDEFAKTERRIQLHHKSINSDSRHRINQHVNTIQHETFRKRLELTKSDPQDGSTVGSTSNAQCELNQFDENSHSNSSVPQAESGDENTFFFMNLKREEEFDDLFEEPVEDIKPVSHEELMEIVNQSEHSSNPDDSTAFTSKNDSTDTNNEGLEGPPSKRTKKSEESESRSHLDSKQSHSQSQSIKNGMEMHGKTMEGMLNTIGNIDLFFESILALAKTLSPLDQVILQKNIANNIFEMKIAELTRKNDT